MASGTYKVPQTQMLVESVTKDNMSMAGDSFDYWSFNANTVPITKTGYTPVGVVGFRIANATSSGVNGTRCMCYGAYLVSSTEARVYIRNLSSATAKFQITLYILYQKD